MKTALETTILPLLFPESVRKWKVQRQHATRKLWADFNRSEAPTISSASLSRPSISQEFARGGSSVNDMTAAADLTLPDEILKMKPSVESGGDSQVEEWKADKLSQLFFGGPDLVDDPAFAMDGTPLKRSSRPIIHTSHTARRAVNSVSLRLDSLDDFRTAMEGVWKRLVAVNSNDQQTQTPSKSKEDLLFCINELQGALDWLREHHFLDGQQLEYHESIAMDSALPLLFFINDHDGCDIYDGLVSFATFNRWYRLVCEVILAKRETAVGRKEDLEAAANHIREAILYAMRAEGMIADDRIGDSVGAYTGTDSMNPHPHVPVYVSPKILSVNSAATVYASPSAAFSAGFGRRVVAPQPIGYNNQVDVDDTISPTAMNLRFVQPAPEGSVLSGFVADVVASDEEEEDEDDDDNDDDNDVQ
jgi:hypothetical protein